MAIDEILVQDRYVGLYNEKLKDILDEKRPGEIKKEIALALKNLTETEIDAFNTIRNDLVDDPQYCKRLGIDYATADGDNPRASYASLYLIGKI